MRESDFSGSTFNGAYMEKAVAYRANFTGNYSNIFSHVEMLSSVPNAFILDVWSVLNTHYLLHYLVVWSSDVPYEGDYVTRDIFLLVS